MSYNSNFVSDFSGFLANKDILTSISDPSNVTITTGYSVAIRHFVLGNLLIQFTSSYNTGGNPLNAGTGYTCSFAPAYDDIPYCVIPVGYNTGGNGVVITVKAVTSTNFSFHVASNSGSINFLVIGPRPTSL